MPTIEITVLVVLHAETAAAATAGVLVRFDCSSAGNHFEGAAHPCRRAPLEQGFRCSQGAGSRPDANYLMPTTDACRRRRF